MNAVQTLKAETLASVLLMNAAGKHFSMSKLPYQLQWAPVFSFITGDFNDDGKTDIVAAGNFYGTVPYEGRYDAMLPLLLLQQEKLHFTPIGPIQSGLETIAEARDLKMIQLAGKRTAYLMAVNNGKIAVYEKRK